MKIANMAKISYEEYKKLLSKILEFEKIDIKEHQAAEEVNV